MYKPLYLVVFETDFGMTKGQFKSREYAEKFAQAKASYDGIPVRMRKSFAYADAWTIYQPVKNTGE